MRILTKIPFRPWQFGFASRLQICVDLSRLLLGLAFVELLTMPLTQHFWAWDGFLRGGQDFELGLFVIVSCLCLVLLRAQHTRQRIGLLLALRRLILLACQPKLFRSTLIAVRAAGAPDDPAPRRSAGMVLAPLQI